MKTSLKTILVIAFSALATVVYTSCNRDQCKTIVCANQGVCNSGVCTCPAGYEGSNCETVSRDKFIGNWSVFEKGSITQASQYPISISKGVLITDVVITNFYNYFIVPVNASVIHDTLFIPNQQYQGKVLFGVSYVYTSTTYGQYGAINMEYEIVDTATGNVNDFGYNSIVDHSLPSAWNK